jgi:hypothetical protein
MYDFAQIYRPPSCLADFLSFYLYLCVLRLGGEIWANRLLLSMVSEVFRAQFFGDLAIQTEERCLVRILFVYGYIPVVIASFY